ncbi:hypothetical protein BAE44_0009078 [Dichanthelium oligosanthes]|uniref:DNA repair metallo-beta-lactamase domain-containing protein n=1 Tax=Dichanthelium oligosanthes TaxID=888268 RepID=A0A1E5VXQ2_9POAL|nr:hypothetical protein BAE44_0009078 [Dichanthelium oligosanthes]
MPIDMPRGLPFAVDTWGPSSRHRRHRFLTHAHRDHLVGAGAAADGGCGTVYATRLTLALALRHSPQLECWEFVEMEVGRTVAVDDPAGAYSVTAYDANHCPGNLFVSNCSTSVRVMTVIACIWNHPHAPFVYLACDLLGHEDILVEVSRTFGLKIYVDRKLDCFKALSLTAPEIITDDPSSRFQMVGFRQLYEKASRKLEEARATLQPEPLFIRPSTQWYAICARSQKPSLTEAEQDEFGVWHICFSIHSSRDELEQALQLLQPQWVISTTPLCFAIELSYVKKHCFKTRLTADDPLWKIFRDPLQKLASSPCLVLAPETHTDKDHSDFVGEDDQSSSSTSSEECTYLNVSNLELKFVPSPLPEEPDITLFGRARFGSQAIDIMKEEVCNQYITFEEGCLEEARACALVDLVHGNSEDVETNSATDCVMKHALSHQVHIEAGDEVGCCQHEASSRQLGAFQRQQIVFEEGCLEARACALADLVHGNSEDVETNSATVCVMKHAPSHQDHIEAGDEVGCCQHEASSRQLEAFQAQSSPTVQRNILVLADQHGKFEAAIESKSLSSSGDSNLSMVRSGETTNCQKEPLCIIGSSKCLNPSLKRLYRSRNIPVPRPLPSLARLFEPSKRVKMQPSTNYSSLNSRHSLP